jgi:hypothetical protein
MTSDRRCAAQWSRVVRVRRSTTSAWLRHADLHVEIALEVGHVPHLEAADWTVDAYRRWRASPSVHLAD